jgi:precorrin-2 dehydrogenase / sirohydrochlorin ferrochelatase
MDAFPAFFPLAGRKVVVAGSGEGAENKARLFDGSPATLVRLTEDQARSAAAFEGAALVFLASPDEAFLEAGAALARSVGAAVNVVDHPALCDFYTPALIDRGAVVAAVGATGAAPLLAAMLRNDIEAVLPEGTGRIADLFRTTRDEVRAALPDMGPRRAFLRQALRGPAAEAALAGDVALAETRLREALAAFDAKAASMGRVDFVVAVVAPDLLSIRAARSLSQADVLIADAERSADILAVARRDARRLPLVEMATLRLIELAAEGLRVVCVIEGRLDPSIPHAIVLAGAGAAVFHQAPDQTWTLKPSA